VENQRWQFRLDDDVTLAVESARINGERATVVIQETTFYSDGLFSSNQNTRSFNMNLTRNGEAWQINKADSYWLACWTQKGRCP